MRKVQNSLDDLSSIMRALRLLEPKNMARKTTSLEDLRRWMGNPRFLRENLEYLQRQGQIVINHVGITDDCVRIRIVSVEEQLMNKQVLD